MSIKRTLLAVVSALFVLPGTAQAVPDYPPSGAVVEVVGDVVTGAVVEVRVMNCTLGERVRIAIESLRTTNTFCETPIESFAAPDEASGRRPGVSSQQIRLPDAPAVLDGTALLADTDETLEFVLDVRATDDAPSPVSTSGAASTGGLGGWPYLILALLIGVGFVFVVAFRRRPENP